MGESERKPTVLIVENDRAVRVVMAQVVEKMDYDVLEAERVVRALPLLEEGGVDAMLLDMHMPGPHGHHLLQYLKKHGISVPPTIVVSGFLEREMIEELIGMGVQGIISKPFHTKRLMDELRRVLENRQGGGFAFCPQCGTGLQTDDVFCRQCGTTLEREVRCPGCAAVCEPGDRFCGQCGALLAGAQETDEGAA